LNRESAFPNAQAPSVSREEIPPPIQTLSDRIEAILLLIQTTSHSIEEIPPPTHTLSDSSEEISPPTQTLSDIIQEMPSSSRNNLVSEQLSFRILDETSKPFPKFNMTGHSLVITFNSQGEEQERTTYLKECITTPIT
jgi:hypothetical protein